MALPRQAQEQVELADRLLAELHAAQDVPSEQPKQEAPEPPEPPEPPLAPVGEAEPEPEPEPEPKKDYEAQYRVLKGKYDNEVPRLHRQVSELNSRIAEMQAVIDDFKRSQTPPAQLSLVTQEEIDEYGPELVDLIGRKAKELYDPVVNTLKSELTELKGKLGGVSQTVQMSARDRLIAKLDAEVQDWQEVNKSQDFLQWLDMFDPYSGQQRGAMLRAAYEQNDAERVVAFFTGFLDEYAAVAPQPVAPAPQRRPTVSLEDQVAPGRRKHVSGNNGAQREKRIWTQGQIADFYREVQQGKFRGREAEQRGVEQDIISAATEGRIR